MTITPLKSIKLPLELVMKLKALRKPHQAIAGVIEELLANGSKLSQEKPDERTTS